MSNEVNRCTITRKVGSECLHDNGSDVGTDLLAFWQWSTSDLVSNVTRGRLAEFIVARALGISTDGVRDEWAPFDLITPTGVKIEVKSAAFVQSWHQTRLSSISYLTPLTRAWDANTNVQSPDAKRQADVYVFALLDHKDRATLDPLNVGQWRFYVVPTSVLNSRARSQHSITLRTLERYCGPGLPFHNLAAAVARAAATECAPETGDRSMAISPSGMKPTS